MLVQQLLPSPSDSDMTLLRICSSIPALLSIDSPSLKAVKFGEQDVFPLLPNRSTIVYHVGEISRCLDMIAANQTDLVTNWISLSSVRPHVKFLYPVDQSPSNIISAYDTVSSTSNTDVLSSFGSFSLAVDGLTLILLLLVMLFGRLHSRTHRRFNAIRNQLRRPHRDLAPERPATPHAFVLSSMMLKQFSADAVTRSNRKSLSFRVMHTGLLFFFFMIHFFFVSFIKTELVTTEKATILESFEQVLRVPGLLAKWLIYDGESESFAQAKPSSPENRLWLRSFPRSVIKLNESNGLSVIQAILQQEQVLVGSSTVMAIAYATMCPMSRASAVKSRMIMRSAHDSPRLKASIYNDRLDPWTVRKVNRRVLLACESGIMTHLLLRITDSMSEQNPSDPDSCQRNDVQPPAKPEILAKTVTDFASLADWSSAFFVAAFAIFLLEVIVHLCTRRRSNRVAPLSH